MSKAFKKKKTKLGITTHIMNSQNEAAVWNPTTDKLNNTIRTQIQKEDYQARAEISIYGDKVAIISFGKEAIGMIIQSQQIADAQRQLYLLAERGATATSKA